MADSSPSTWLLAGTPEKGMLPAVPPKTFASFQLCDQNARPTSWLPKNVLKTISNQLYYQKRSTYELAHENVPETIS